MSDILATPTKPIGTGATNSSKPGSSNVDVKVPAEPLCFLRPEMGEVIVVPAEDANAVRSQYNKLSDMMAELHSANSAVQLCEENLMELAAKHATRAVVAQAEKVYDMALDWQMEAHDAVHKLYEGLVVPVEDPKPAGNAESKEDKVNSSGAGAKLIELIALKKESNEEQEKKKAEDKERKIDDGVFKGKIASFKSAKELRDAKKWPKKTFEKIVYLPENKLKSSWPKFKDAQKTKWREVYKKGDDGKHRIDKEKLNDYVKEQLKSSTKISLNQVYKQVFGDELEASKSGTLGKWADEWNKTHKSDDKHAPLSAAGLGIADIDLSAGAQLMRYSCGASLDSEISAADRHVSVKAEGHAAIDFAKASADLELYVPRKDGWLWTIYDLNGAEYQLIAGRCKINVSVSGVVGASVNAELSLAVDAKALDNGASGKTSQVSAVRVRGKRGRKGKDVRKKGTRSINSNDEENIGTLDASVSGFAGIKAEGSLTGSLEWRNPESKEKEFIEVASITPSVGGYLGIAGDAKFRCEFDADRGMFMLTAHAGLCIGVGAEGGISFSVSALQLGKFVMCLQYKLVYWQFKNLEIIEERAFQALYKLAFLAVQTGKAMELFYMRGIKFIDDAVADANEAFAKAQARRDLAQRLLDKPEALRYAPPEAKGMLIYQLTRHGTAAEAATGHALAGDNYLGAERRAVLAVLKTATTKAEATNIIQHISSTGAKGEFNIKLNALKEFFRSEAAGNIDIPFYESPYGKQFDSNWDQLAMSGDFGSWYAAFDNYLMDEYPHGYAIAEATSPEYEALRYANANPLFASEGMNAYYSNLA